MPLKREVSPFKSLPQTRPFILSDFLAILHQTPPPLLSCCGMKGNYTQLYQRFIEKSANFQAWLATRLNDINAQLRLAHLESLCTVELTPQLLSTHSVVTFE